MKKLVSVLVVAVVGCASQTGDPPEVVDDGLDLAARAEPPALTCEQPTGGCVPTGYRHAVCTATGVKNWRTLRICVQAVCPDAYGYPSPLGETCHTGNVRVVRDGDTGGFTAVGFIAVLPDATYNFVARHATKDGSHGPVVASTSLTVLSSIGENTQCGGDPQGCF